MCPHFRDGPDDVAHRLMAGFVRLNRQHWHRRAADGLRPHEFSLLHHIRRFSGDSSVGPRVSDLSAHLGVTPPTITQQVSDLEKRGLVERRREDADRRAVRVVLSAAGIELLEQNRAAILGLFSEVAEHLGPERSENLAALLAETADFLEGAKEEPKC